MQVGRWGNSLAVRIPAAVAEALDLKEGDDVQIEAARDKRLSINRGRTPEEALAHLDEIARPLPPGWRFSRDEGNERSP